VDLSELVMRGPVRLGTRLPWSDPEFSARMLAEHLDQRHDLASRRTAVIDAQAEWLAALVAPGGRVLDLGCGPGAHLERLARHGHECVGLDMAPAAIAYARDRALEARSSCRYVQQDLRGALPPGAFALVICLFGELSTFAGNELRAVLRNVAGALTPGGRVVIELSTLAGVRRKAERALRWYTAAGGLFGDGPHAVLPEAAWFEAERATGERWWVLREGAERPAAFGSTTRAHDERLPGALADAGLRVEDQFGDVCGSPHDPHADFETFLLAADRHDRVAPLGAT
jgi:SAM-dependent methyltransferase